MGDLGELLDALIALPPQWHGEGTLNPVALRAIVRWATAPAAPQLPLRASVETGTGLSTLLLSHISEHHTVFTVEDGDSYRKVASSPLLCQRSVAFELGPSQLTLPRFSFEFGEEAASLDFALIDGPHGFPFPQLEYYYLYPHLHENSLLVLDDIHIPTIYQMFCVLREDSMFDLLEVCGYTAVFRRTAAPTFSPTGDNWWTQPYNTRRYPVNDRFEEAVARLRSLMPAPVRTVLGRALLRAMALRPGSSH